MSRRDDAKVKGYIHINSSPLHGLIRNGQTWLLDGVVLLSLSEAPVGRGVGEDGVRHSVGGVALHAVLDVTDRQLSLQEEVELAVWQADCHVYHSAGQKYEKYLLLTQLALQNCKFSSNSVHFFDEE